jgi:hypothetical protein
MNNRKIQLTTLILISLFLVQTGTGVRAAQRNISEYTLREDMISEGEKSHILWIKKM